MRAPTSGVQRNIAPQYFIRGGNSIDSTTSPFCRSTTGICFSNSQCRDPVSKDSGTNSGYHLPNGTYARAKVPW